MSFANVGKRWSVTAFPSYLQGLTPPVWAKSVTIHHCWAPSLAQRPSGFTDQHLRSLQGFYQKTKGWSAGPHAFTDEDEIHGMTPFTSRGVHAVSFNRNSIGIEMLGNYDSEDPTTGRGLAVCETTAAATRALLSWLRLPVTESTVLFHRDDPKTNKSCPGTKVDKKWFLDLVKFRVWQVPPSTETILGPLAAEPVPVALTIAEKLGITYAEAAKRLTRSGKMTLFDGKWIEGAYYESASSTTVAPLAEIEAVISAL